MLVFLAFFVHGELFAILPIVGPCSRRGIMHVNVIAVALADKILAREDCRELWVGPSPQPAAYQRPCLGVLEFSAQKAFKVHKGPGGELVNLNIRILSEFRGES